MQAPFSNHSFAPVWHPVGFICSHRNERLSRYICAAALHIAPYAALNSCGAAATSIVRQVVDRIKQSAVQFPIKTNMHEMGYAIISESGAD
jgi:hypothetical protein